MTEKVNIGAQLGKLGKEMPIAIALSVGLRCEFCTRLHVPQAVKAGASRAEILEAAGVSTMMVGGPGLTFVGVVLLEELDKLGIK